MPVPAHWGRTADPETPDPRPLEIPAHCRVPETLEDIVAKLLHQQKMMEADEEAESFDEANDFDLDDELDGLLDFSPYELPDTLPEAAGGFQQIDPPPESPLAAKAAENSSPEASTDAGTPESTNAGE